MAIKRFNDYNETQAYTDFQQLPRMVMYLGSWGLRSAKTAKEST